VFTADAASKSISQAVEDCPDLSDYRPTADERSSVGNWGQRDDGVDILPSGSYRESMTTG
jgi:hypothetical protein